jgi:hypothetical protein
MIYIPEVLVTWTRIYLGADYGVHGHLGTDFNK